jgi:hypothetical protein
MGLYAPHIAIQPNGLLWHVKEEGSDFIHNHFNTLMILQF